MSIQKTGSLPVVEGPPERPEEISDAEAAALAAMGL
jgi:hypothetical protein